MSASSLQLIRNWLPFGRRQDSPAETRALHGWLDELTGAPALAVAQSLLNKLQGFIVEERNLHARLKLLEAFYGEARRVLPSIEEQVGVAPLPLPSEALQAALAADNLLKALASGYGTIVSSVRAQRLPSGTQQLGRIACARQIACLVRRQQLAYRAYAPASENSWLQLHQAYEYARLGGFTDFQDSQGKLEALYVGALLLAYADPTKFSRGDIASLIDCVAHYAALARVNEPAARMSLRGAKLNALFVVGAADKHAGRRSDSDGSDKDAATASWLIDCGTLIGALEQVLDRTEKGHSPNPQEPAIPLPVLRNVLNMWRGQPTRRFARQKFRPRADLFVGLDHVVATLAGKSWPTRREDAKNAVESLSEWAILDESPDGFGIRYLKGDTRQIQVGEVVGLRPRERDRLHVCLVRRVVNAGVARLEVGLQTLSPHAIAIAIGGSAHPIHALLLPSMPGYRGEAGVIAPVDSVINGSLIEAPSGAQAWRVDRLMEVHKHHEIWHLQTAA